MEAGGATSAAPFSVEELYEVEALLLGVRPENRRPELVSALAKVEAWREETERSAE